jgi:hypothetical protein
MISRATYLAASYRANIPKLNSLQVVKINTEWVRGEFDSALKAREVFDYFRPPNARKPDTAPYIAFATCGSDKESILRFTREWGPLAGQEVFGLERKLFNAPETRNSLNYFSFTLYSWREIQQRFKRAIAALSPIGDGEAKPPQIYMHMPYDLSISTVISEHPNGLRPELRPNSLLSAFWLMLWMDASVKGIRVCGNEKCQTEFRGTRSDRIYCCNECALAVARRTWWREKGSPKRRNLRNATKKRL